MSAHSRMSLFSLCLRRQGVTSGIVIISNSKYANMRQAFTELAQVEIAEACKGFQDNRLRINLVQKALMKLYANKI